MSNLIILKVYKRLSIGSKLKIQYLVIAKTHANNDKLSINKEKNNVLLPFIFQ